LAAQVFHFPYQFNPIIGLAGIGVGIAIVGIAGVLGTRMVLTQPQIVSLRQGV
jgi:predicted lysophospholipase L1 biosynthesis ABC-type transport system permease subunit